jgi:hypothetical protein
VEKLTRAPHEIAQTDFDELKKHFSDPEIVDVHMLAGLANLTNRLTDPLGLELEFPEEKSKRSQLNSTDRERIKLTSGFIRELVGGNPLLKNFSCISHTPRHPLAIQIFQQRNRIFAAHSG